MLSRLLCLMVLSCVVLGGAVSCRRIESPPQTGIPAASLAYGASVYLEFQKAMMSSPVDSEFARYAADPKNYLVTINEDDGGYVFAFHLKHLKDSVVLDGGVIYRVWRDGHIERVG